MIKSESCTEGIYTVAQWLGYSAMQGHVWQVFSSPCKRKYQGSGNSIQVKANGLENVPDIQNGHCGAAQHAFKIKCTYGRHASWPSLDLFGSFCVKAKRTFNNNVLEEKSLVQII